MFLEPKLGIIVPTRNETTNLPRLLKSIARSAFPTRSVFIVDASDDGETRKIAESFGCNTISAPPNLAAQRNAGAAACPADAYFFVDADMELEDGLLQEITGLIDGGAKCIVVPERTIPKDWLGRARAFERDLHMGDMSVAAARIFSKEVFSQCKGYDVELANGGEDWLLSKAASEITTVHHTSRAILHHEPSYTMRLLITKYFKYGQGFYGLYRRSPKLFFEHSNPVRRSIRKNVATILRSPIATSQYVAFKGLTYGAGAAGFLIAGARSIRAIRRSS